MKDSINYEKSTLNGVVNNLSLAAVSTVQMLTVAKLYKEEQELSSKMMTNINKQMSFTMGKSK